MEKILTLFPSIVAAYDYAKAHSAFWVSENAIWTFIIEQLFLILPMGFWFRVDYVPVPTKGLLKASEI